MIIVIVCRFPHVKLFEDNNYMIHIVFIVMISSYFLSNYK
jgi:hypothetical protein